MVLFLAGCGGGDTESGSDPSSAESEPSTDPSSAESEPSTDPSSAAPAPENETPEEAEVRLRAAAKAIMDAVEVPSPGLVDIIGDYELRVETEPLVGILSPCDLGGTSTAAIGHRYSTPTQGFDAIVWWPRDGTTPHMEEVAATEVGCLERFTDAEVTEFASVSVAEANGFRWLKVPERFSPQWTTLVERDGWIITGTSTDSPEAADQLVLAVLEAMAR